MIPLLLLISPPIDSDWPVSRAKEMSLIHLKANKGSDKEPYGTRAVNIT